MRVLISFLLLLTMIVSAATHSYGQSGGNVSSSPGRTGTVSGRVVSDNGEPFAGIVVMLKSNNQINTVTNKDGRFTIAAGNDDILVFSSFGLRTLEMNAGRIGAENIVMSESDYSIIDEVVVVGYGNTKRGHLAGAVSTISSDDITVTPLVSTTAALAGKLPGLIVKQEGGLPGFDEAELNIRGFGSPLVIVDGIETSFNDIDANEIESVSILKDASAAIYGARAGNGVILVTTKRGTVGKPEITYRGSFTAQVVGTIAKTVNAGQYAELTNEYQVRNGVSEDLIMFRPAEIDKYYSGGDPDYPNTDWYDYLLRKIAPQTNHNLSIRGGNNAVKFYAYAGYNRQESIIKEGGPTFDRYNLRTNFDAVITKGLTLSGDVSIISADSRLSARVGGRSGATTDGQIWEDLRTTIPIYATSLPDPTKVAFGGRSTLGGGNVTLNRNLAGEDRRQRLDVIAQAKLEYKIPAVQGLQMNLNIAQKFYYTKSKSFPYFPATYTYNYASDTYIQQTAASQSPMSQSAADARILTGNFSVQYKKVFQKKHDLSAQLIYEVIDDLKTTLSGTRNDFVRQDIPYLFAGGPAYQTVTSSATMMGRMSFIGRLNYVLKSRYILEVTSRYDGSANYPKGGRWGFFPSASVAWRISEEPFIKQTGARSVIHNLKLRAGISQTGNDIIRTPSGSIISYPALGGYNMSSSIFYIFHEQALAAIAPASEANPKLTWETMRTYNAGFDYSLFRGVVYGEADAFYRTRNGIPATRSTSVSSIYGGSLPYENLNKMSTRGFEFMVGYRKRFKALAVNVSGNISWARSKWDHYDEPVYTDPDQIRVSKKTGKWTDLEYGYLSNGLFTNQAQIDALGYNYAEAGNGTLRPGDIIYLDYNGDKILTTNDYVVIGNGRLPHWMFGFDVKLAYKNLSFRALFQGALGFTTSVTLDPGNSSIPIEAVYKYRWTEWNNNANGLLPRYMGAGYNSWTSDFYQKKGDYLRLKDLNLSYNLPKRWFNNKIGSMSVFVSGSNLFTISELLKFGIDPEAPSGSSTAYYPQMRTFTFGVIVSL